MERAAVTQLPVRRRRSIAKAAQRLIANVERVVIGKHDEIVLVVAAFLAGGHVLLEDVPGTAKTILARALASSIEGTTFRRVPHPAQRRAGDE
jgi:MoxR-like ATPase